jgi:hypothetical protein
MAKADKASPTAPPKAHDLTVRSNPDIRPLTDFEIEALENALGKPVDRKYLVLWVSRAISDIVRLSLQPTRSEYRTLLWRIARGGRQWLQQIEACPGGTSLPPSIDQAVLTATVTKFCDQVESLADQIAASIKPGHPRTPRLLEAFLDRMIGIAKRAKVLPSTPSRAVAPRRPPPAFLQFVLVAISTARAVIKSSELSEVQEKAALSILRFQSKKALIKIVERLRGRIQDYRHSAYGLSEWNSE